jgi:pyruvate,water dikinase
MQPMAAEHSVYELAAFAAAATEPERLLGEVESGVVVVGSRAHEFRERLDLHLRRFGHQIYSFDPLVPTLVEDPRPVLAAVRTYLGGKESPDARFARLAAEREAAVTQIRQTLSPRRWRKFAGFLAAAQEAVSLRENALFELGRAWLPARQTLLALGQRLAHTTALDAPEDVFWLTRDELHTAAAELDADGRAGSLRDRSPARQRAWRRRQRLQPPYTLPLGSKPKFWWKYVFPVPELHGRSSGDVIRGTGVSPGRVTATARVVRTHEDIAHLQSGEILVARTTPPAWTPLLARAGGLVTDLGGPLAHGSIVAREYGIPAVMGTGSATQHIKDGQSIVVDGSSGCVFLA